jgi:glycosyltransferase involved in cell wall biosynthesis
MRIAMVGPFGLHPNKTMSSRAFGLARPLVQQGHQVQIFMPPWHEPDEADQSWQEDGVAFRYTSLPGGTLGISWQLIRETLAWEPQAVHCFKPKAYSGLAAWWLWQFHRRKIRIVIDSDDWEGWGGWNDRAPYTPLQKRFFSWQERWGMAHSHYLTVASKALESIAWSQGIAPHKVVYLPNGAGITLGEKSCTEEEIAAKRRALGVDERPVLLLYSRLFEFDTARLVNVMAGVKTAVPDIAILAIGESLYSADAADLHQKMTQSGVLDAVIDLGWVSPDQLPLLLNCADVGIYLMDDSLLNRTKCPVKLADMIAMGVPVVGEAVGQVPEYILNGESGLLRVPGDVEGLIDDVVYLLRNKVEASQMSLKARSHYLANFSWSRLAERMEHAYG